MTERAEKRALAYIKKCERGRKFQDFEAQIMEHLDDPAIKQDESSFVGHVVTEAWLLNRLNNTGIPSWNIPIQLIYRCLIFKLRCKARISCGATTKFHRQIYHQRINEKLIEKHRYLSFTKQY